MRTFLNIKQLPPIYENENNHVLDNPHIFLDEIIRQAYDSEIIRLSMWIREGNKLSDYKCDNQEVKIIKKNEVVTGMYKWADQIICATNAQKDRINTLVRKQIKSYGNEPEIGDRVISLKNHWKFFSNKDMPLVNGSIGYIKYFYKKQQKFPYYLNISEPVDYLYATIEKEENENENYSGVPIDYDYLVTGKSKLDSKQKYKISKSKGKYAVLPPFEFDYAYAISCHRAQGSQWNKVLVQEEAFPFDKEEHARWLYTAITRAVDKVVIIEK